MDEEKIENESVVYEMGYHLLPTIDESEVPGESAKIKSIIEENGGSVISEGMPKMTVLAYDISKAVDSRKLSFNKSYFGWIKFEADSSRIDAVKNKAENMSNILRFIIIKTVKEDTMHTPKIPMYRKENGAKDEKTEESPEKAKATEAEIDKSIESLVIES